MSSGESGSESSSSSSEGSDTDRSEKRDLVIPSPVLLSDADGNDCSLSQHELQVAMKKLMADHDVVQNFTSGSHEEEEEEVEQSILQSIADQSGNAVESTSTEAIFLNLSQ
jgi:hypothetical protein